MLYHYTNNYLFKGNSFIEVELPTTWKLYII